MNISGAIDRGFSTLNRNWQLLLIHLVGRITNCILFVVLVILPLIIMLVSSGINPEDMLLIHQSPGLFVSEHRGLLFISFFLVFLYILVASTVSIYILGGKAGILSRSCVTSENFSLQNFFSEAKRMFLPTVRFLTVTGLIGIGLMFLTVLFSLGLYAILVMLGDVSKTLQVFVAIIAGIPLILGLLSGIIWFSGAFLVGLGDVAISGTTSLTAFRNGSSMMMNSVSIFLLFTGLLVGYILVAVIVSTGGLAIRLIPLVGLIIALPYQIVAALIQGYAGMFLLSTGISLIYEYAKLAHEKTQKQTDLLKSNPEA